MRQPSAFLRSYAVAQVPISIAKMKPRRAPRQEGQILILMALLATTLIIMFGMVVSIGHLVEARMNLQNAVDLAAMSGASYQARYLNHLALVNYRLRQNYKFVLYDLYVTQSRYNKGLQDELSSGSGPFGQLARDRLNVGICQQSYGFRPQDGGIGQGRPTQTDTDMCKNVTGSKSGGGIKIPPIEPYTGPLVNPELIAINNTIKNLSAEQKAICNSSGPDNEYYFYYIMKQLYGRQRFQVQRMLQIAQSFDDDFGTANEIKGSDTASANRAIYATFAANLIAANHPNQAQGVTLEYLNPSDTRAPRSVPSDPDAVASSGASGSSGFQRYFSANSVGFKIYVVDFMNSGSGCETKIKQVQCPGLSDCPTGKTIVSLSRTRTASAPGSPPKIPFNVVLRATVKRPKLLFWPTGLTPSISAVSAAKPFGSRIGPTESQTYLETQGTDQEPTSPGLANMAFYPGDWGDPNSTTIPGVGHKRVINKLLGLLTLTGAWPPELGSGENQRRPSMSNSQGSCAQNPEQFLCYALAPTLYESLFYVPFPFPKSNYKLESLRTAFPNELPIVVAPSDSTYSLRDRDDNSGGDYWHETINIYGDGGLSGSADRPTFFGSRKSVLSSWNPAVKPADFSGGGLWASKGDRLGRYGYQIKLMSVFQICKEIQRGIQGGSGLSLGALSGYCGSSPSATPTADSDILY